VAFSQTVIIIKNIEIFCFENLIILKLFLFLLAVSNKNETKALLLLLKTSG